MSCTGRRCSTPRTAAGTRRISSRCSTMPRASCPTPPSRAAKRSPPSCPSSSARSCAAACPSASTSTTASAYRARHLALVCAKLGVTLIHARPFAPQGKGKLERWFRTGPRSSSCPRSSTPTRASLEALNQRLVDLDRGRVSRHAAPRPAGRDAARAAGPRAAHHVTLPTQDLTDLFLFEEKRKVQPRSHRQSPRRRLRGRRRARRPDRHAPLRPRPR